MQARKGRKGLIIGVAIILVLAVFVVGGVYRKPILEAVSPQASISLVNATYLEEHCGFLGPDYNTFDWTFTLVNTGGADGYASVSFFVNSQHIVDNKYFVKAHSQAVEHMAVQGPEHPSGCPPEVSTISLTSTQSA